ncbi:YdjY domain-containing protein [Bythopirellula polymerisocia]|uniref:Uncharacterized protein n=1 Tax=Bythopirellula polymerisocia TaxID=2528003 RepID=A0A5C6CDM9_9BACT|nr:YdjY domain-containing protein [Bythopirellula polymerisocia]TWU20899.1 hypothetical protein Pla144_47990 [Bythopirellula polymerisocia]
MSRFSVFACFAACIIALQSDLRGWAQEDDATLEGPVSGSNPHFDPHTGAPLPPKLPPPEGAKAFPKPDVLWIDAKKKKVYVDGYVSLREGMLEMFACPVGTKEHESVVAVFSRAQTIHAALLAVGAKVGHPVSFRPKFRPAAGTEIDIEVRWQDDNGKWQTARAQDWVKDIKTGKPMSQPWVFAGSGFWKDEETGREYYQAEAGDLICVSNFSTATLDIPIESSQANDGLVFEANTNQIPPLATPVRLVLTPKLKN